MTEPTNEEKQHMLDLVEEFKDIVEALPKTRSRPMVERIAVKNRLGEIRAELKDFLRKYPSCKIH